MAVPRIERREYFNKLIAFRDKQLTKVVTGVRRCGKSTLLAMFQDWLLEHGVSQAQIIAINLEDFDNEALRDAATLHEYVKSRLSPTGMTYVFIDEVQQCLEFPRVISSLSLRQNVDIYLTGSNATMLSGEIATLIAGRYVEIRMLPFSFREYVTATGMNDKLSLAYRTYLEESSFPYTLELSGQAGAIHDYLDALYNTIVVKDIASRHNIGDIMQLQSVTRFLFDNVGNMLSSKKIADTLTSAGRKADVRTVEKYLAALAECFVAYPARRYNIKGKQYLKTLEKFYVVDMGLRTALLGSRAADVGHVLENVIYLELLRRGCEVGVGKLDSLEVDFVAMDSQKRTTYIQVAASVRDTQTLDRELAPLKKINDHYPKLLLTLDDDPPGDYDGIIRSNALDWLMGDRDNG